MAAAQFKTNNFDLIRLLAAAQVAIHHTSSHLQVNMESTFFWLTGFFPGVPMFFFISGFLISRSFEANPNPPEYALNRILRIFPALWVCLGASVVAVVATGYLARQNIDLMEFLIWVLAQMTFVQFFNPDFLREFGVGVINGSLWTISVELQFYVIVPVLYWVLSKLTRQVSQANKLIILLIMIFLGVNQGYVFLSQTYSEHILHKLVGVSFAPWFYMFLIGILAQRSFESLHRHLSGRFLLLFCGYLLVAILASRMQIRFGNTINPAMFIMLCALIVSLAYSAPSLATRILNRNDLSYGIYIYHMPVVNVMLFLGFEERMTDYLMGLGITIVLAGLSWFLVEKPAITLKRHPLYPVVTQRASGPD